MFIMTCITNHLFEKPAFMLGTFQDFLKELLSEATNALLVWLTALLKYFDLIMVCFMLTSH